MIKRRLSKTALLLLGSMTIIHGNGQADQHDPPPFQPRSNPDVLVEAREFATEYWNRQYRRCGVYYFTKLGAGFRATTLLRVAVTA